MAIAALAGGVDVVGGEGWEHYTGGGDCTTCYVFYLHITGDIYPSRAFYLRVTRGSTHPGQRTGPATSGQRNARRAAEENNIDRYEYSLSGTFLGIHIDWPHFMAKLRGGLPMTVILVTRREDATRRIS
jgi:hypothetical protein